MADLSTYVRPVEVSLTHVAARQELRQLMQELGLEEVADAPAAEAAASEPALPEQKVA